MKRNMFLLCLDNIEAMIQEEEPDQDGNDAFAALLSDLVDNCPGLFILVTSTITLSELTNKLVPEVQYVRSLKNTSAAKLFYERCGTSVPFKEDEFAAWINNDKNYPYNKVLSEKEVVKIANAVDDTERISEIKKAMR